jgi:hypothetical protein
LASKDGPGVHAKDVQGERVAEAKKRKVGIEQIPRKTISNLRCTIPIQAFVSSLQN